MKKQENPHHITRRKFLRQSACAALGVTGVVNTLMQLKLVNNALAQSGGLTGYKALVVVFLAGGNDSNNMLIPRIGHPGYNDYKDARQLLAIYDPNDTGAPSGATLSVPLTTTDGNYGMHPNLANPFAPTAGHPVADLFNNGKLAFVANVGTLAQPILTRDDYINGTVPVPPQLFSHADQQTQWQSSVPDKPFLTGWGGRVADLLNAGSNIPMLISLDGINFLQVGLHSSRYAVSPDGAVSLAGYGTNYSSAKNSDGSYKTNTAGKQLQAFESVMNYVHSNLIEEGYNGVVRNARADESLLGDALHAASSSGVNFDTFFGPNPSGLVSQFKMVAQLIAGNSGFGSPRQIFFVRVSGYDTHQYQLAAHANLMTELGTSLKNFNDAMVALQMDSNVLTLTHSDFTRTLTPNSLDPDTVGSDHGWGGHHIVMGGAVHGGHIYGTFPSLAVGTGQDVDRNRGRWIPTTSVDQYIAVAAKWLGVDSGNLATVLPNLGRFNDPFGSGANLGYV